MKKDINSIIDQQSLSIISNNKDDFNSIIQHNRDKEPIALFITLYMGGYLAGIRAERKKRKEGVRHDNDRI